MLHKLQLINSGDTVEYWHEGTRCRGEVHGWRLSAGREHRAIVGGLYGSEHEVLLRSIVSRHRDKGAGQGLVEF